MAKNIKSINDGLTKMIELMKKLEVQSESTEKTFIEGMSAIDTQAKKSLQTKQQLTGANKAHREEITKEQKAAQELIKAKQGLEKAQTKQAQLTLQVKKQTQDLVKAQKLQMQAGKGEIKTYEQLSARYRIAAKRAKDLAVQYGVNNRKAREAIATAKKYNDELKKVDKSLGNQQRNVGNYSNALKGLGKQVLALGSAYMGLQGVIAVFKKIGRAVKDNSQLVSDSLDVMKAKFNATFDAIGRAIANMDLSSLGADIRAAREAAEEYTKTQDELGDVMRSIGIDVAKTEAEVFKLRETYTDTGQEATKRLRAVEEANKKLLDLQARRSKVANEAINAELELVAKTLDLNEEEQELFSSFIIDYGKKEGVYFEFIEKNQKALERRKNLEKEITEGTRKTIGLYGQVYTSLTVSATEAQKQLESLNANELKSYDKVKAAEDATADSQRQRIADAVTNLFTQERATQRLINESSRQHSAITRSIALEKKKNKAIEEGIKLEKFKEDRLPDDPGFGDEGIDAFIEAELAAEEKALEESLKRQEDLRIEAGKKEIEDFKKKEEQKKEALKQAGSLILDTLTFFADQRVELANRELEEENLKVDSAERNLDRQIALAEQGYANDVTGAQRALDLQKSTQQAALEEKKRALEQKQKLETIEQGVSIITAVANIIQGFSSIPIVGAILGVAAAGAMIAAFVGQKQQAKAATQTFEDGGVIDLEGGSHASGDDIHFGNKNGVELHAEGKEKAAIFSKKASQKYGSTIDNFVHAANRLELEDRYSRAFDIGAMPVFIENNSNFDSTEIKETNNLLRQMLKNGENSNSFDPVRQKQITRKGNRTIVTHV